MQQYEEQIDRIRKKLVTAKKEDSESKVFGADSHKYFIGKPLQAAELSAFETAYNIMLPEAYKAFLLQLGNGGKSYADSAAGPFYGIYPLGTRIDELTDEPRQYLSKPVKIYPDITTEAWEQLIAEAAQEDISDEEYMAAMGNIYAGILPIGSQGCTYLHGLVLNGEHTGKVVNLDADRQKPAFTFEATFLDWYERWLDEIISGELRRDGPSWFGYNMGGDATSLLEKYQAADDQITQQHCLRGILTKQSVPPALLPVFEKEYLSAADDRKKNWLQILTKFDYVLAKPYLQAYTAIDLLSVFQFIFWYAKDKSNEWTEVIEKHIAGIEDSETFTYCTYLLIATKTDYGHLIAPMTQSNHENIRKTAFYNLGLLANKAAYIDTFITGLNDPSNVVVHAALQALSGVQHPKLLPAYKKIAERFPTEQDYILSNLGHRLHEIGLTVSELRKMM